MSDIVTNAIDRTCIVTENSKKIDYSKQQRYIDDIKLYNSVYKIRNYIINDVTNVKQYIKDLIEENQQLKEQLKQKEDIIHKAKEKNKQIIKDTKSFYRPTSDRIYSGDCLIELATENIEILDNKGEQK